MLRIRFGSASVQCAHEYFCLGRLASQLLNVRFQRLFEPHHGVNHARIRFGIAILIPVSGRWDVHADAARPLVVQPRTLGAGLSYTATGVIQGWSDACALSTTASTKATPLSPS